MAKKPIAIEELSAEQASAELTRLAQEIAEHDKRYFQQDAPTISDAAYDALRKRAQAIEQLFPDLVGPESPSQRVGAAPQEKFGKLKHTG